MDIERDEERLRCRVILGEREQYIEGERCIGREGKIYTKQIWKEMKREYDVGK